MALVRLVFYAAAAYLFFLLGFPQWAGQVYHVASVSIVLGGAIGMFLLLKVLDWSSRAGRLALELAFGAAVAMYFGYTMPLRSGKAPFEQWAEGRRPTRADASEGVARLGLDPHSKPAEWVIALFPRY